MSTLKQEPPHNSGYFNAWECQAMPHNALDGDKTYPRIVFTGVDCKIPGNASPGIGIAENVSRIWIFYSPEDANAGCLALAPAAVVLRVQRRRAHRTLACAPTLCFDVRSNLSHEYLGTHAVVR